MEPCHFSSALDAMVTVEVLKGEEALHLDRVAFGVFFRWTQGKPMGLGFSKLVRSRIFKSSKIQGSNQEGPTPNISILVGGFNPSEKILVSWDDDSQYVEK